MDFFQIQTKPLKGGGQEAYPDFTIGRSTDLMVRGGKFYAVWDEEQGLWSTDEYAVQRLGDRELYKYAEEHGITVVRTFKSFESTTWVQFRRFMANISDNSHTLDQTLTFADTVVKKTDYVSRRLPYSLTKGEIHAWDALLSRLYSPEERAKIEWAIGAVLSGDSKKIQKFLVFYGPPGTGKSTVMGIIELLFAGYVTTFEAKALAGNSNAFATEVFKDHPLVAIQHEGDLSKIEDHTKLNSIISHENMTVNAKYKALVTDRINAFLFMGTNKPVKISDAKSGIIRRLIDVHPTGDRFHPNEYHTLMAQVEFELGAIAYHCLEVYRAMGRNYYSSYRPLEMIFQTDVFFNFVEAHYDIFKEQDGVSLKQAYALYKAYCQDSGLEFTMPQYRFRDELKNYFTDFHDRFVVAGAPIRSYYSGFSVDHFKTPAKPSADGGISAFSLVLEETISPFDREMEGCPAQEAKADGTPQRRWSEVKTTLSEINTSEVHYIKPPEQLIVIDFDLKDGDGSKSLGRNLAAASDWPATYAELSKSGSGVHLHYFYTGDVSELAQAYSEGIEVKTFTGGSSLRRRLTRCNNLPIARISSGLPLKEKKVIETRTIQSEKGLRELIARNLRKEIHPGTKPSIDFIHKILEDAYLSGMQYDVSDLKATLVAFANNSTNQALPCLKIVQKMRFRSEEPLVRDTPPFDPPYVDKEPIIFFDVEVYPNLFVVCWKREGDDNVVSMINPSPQEVEALFKFKLVGFNNRRYDNHILWARYMGYDNEALYKLSVAIVEGKVSAMFGEAYNLSYTDIYDFSSVKKSLKKFQIDLGILHLELDLPWDQPVKDEDIPRVVEYCCNDVRANEAVFESRKGDFVARQILAALSGLSVNDTTQKHTARIIFGEDRNPQRSFIYTDLSKEFPGYVYEQGVSTYRGEVVGEGGYVHAKPGMYENVVVLDIASMHPTSIQQLRLFGDYTPNFTALTAARLAIKHKDYDAARQAMGGRLAPFLVDESQTKGLADALKIVINIVYGLTSAKFDNPFRDVRNKDNIVAKRGALFMIDLKHAVQEQGFDVVHIKTDSIKIPNATPEIIEFVKQFGEKYGYTFEYDPKKDHYDQFCLVNDAVYIARTDECLVPHWTAVGAQFQHPYVFKTLFSKEELTFEDYCEPKSVSQGTMYLDFAHLAGRAHDSMHHVGRTGLFVPVQSGGGILYRVKDGKQYAVTGTKGYFWVEAEMFKHSDFEIDYSYFERLAEEAVATIDYFGPFGTFVG